MSKRKAAFEDVALKKKPKFWAWLDDAGKYSIEIERMVGTFLDKLGDPDSYEEFYNVVEKSQYEALEAIVDECMKNKGNRDHLFRNLVARYSGSTEFDELTTDKVVEIDDWDPGDPDADVLQLRYTLENNTWDIVLGEETIASYCVTTKARGDGNYNREKFIEVIKQGLNYNGNPGTIDSMVKHFADVWMDTERGKKGVAMCDYKSDTIKFKAGDIIEHARKAIDVESGSSMEFHGTANRKSGVFPYTYITFDPQAIAAAEKYRYWNTRRSKSGHRPGGKGYMANLRKAKKKLDTELNLARDDALTKWGDDWKTSDSEINEKIQDWRPLDEMYSV